MGEINGRIGDNFHKIFIDLFLFSRSGSMLFDNWLIVALIIKEVHGEERVMLWFNDLRFGLWL
jgi:hypothetical protein